MTALQLSRDAIEEKILRLEHLEALDRAREGILNFTCYTFPEFEVNWHHREMCRVLNRFIAGEFKRLIVCQPPRTGKSELVSRRLPAYLLGKNPDMKIVAASYSASLASAMNRDVQRIIDSEKYRELFPDTVLPRTMVVAKTEEEKRIGGYIRNSSLFEIVGRRGAYRSAGVGGGVTGSGGDYLIIDDPCKNREEADSPVYRQRVWDWYRSTLYTRQEKDARILVTVTRWHEDDLVGRLLNLAREEPEADQWAVVSLPMVCEGAGSGMITDPRPLGEPLWPNKYPASQIPAMKASAGSRDWAALHQQRPAPEDGLIVKKEWWRYYTKLPEAFEQIIQAWDLTFSGGPASDFVVGVVLGRKGANIYLLDMVRGRLSFTESLNAISALSKRWPRAEAKYVEQAANGHALIDTLRDRVSGLIAVKPLGSKVARANAVAPRIEAGNVHLPDKSIAPWTVDVVNEWTSFPAGANDDIVDAMSHGIAKLAQIPTMDWLPVSVGSATIFPV